MECYDWNKDGRLVDYVKISQFYEERIYCKPGLIHVFVNHLSCLFLCSVMPSLERVLLH